jgi:hypothetical protein
VPKYSALAHNRDVNLKEPMKGWQIARWSVKSMLHFPSVYMTGAAADDWASEVKLIEVETKFAFANSISAFSRRQIKANGARVILKSLPGY